jgi:isoquinoline 1-oxidoreductase subunit alpha
MTLIKVNHKAIKVASDPSTPLLWVLRDELNLTGTKFGCGVAACGACTVHFNGNAIRSCATPVSAVAAGNVMTVESVATQDKVGRVVSDTWTNLDVAQCGYCQSGQIMSATALLKSKKRPTDADIDAAMAGNICRCGTYSRVREAIKAAAKTLSAA